MPEYGKRERTTSGEVLQSGAKRSQPGEKRDEAAVVPLPKAKAKAKVDGRKQQQALVKALPL
eukprot:1824846-Alexandrium_andersonii.AAC.1